MTSTNITRGPIWGAGFLLAAFATLGLPCLAQTEGYDPLRQITIQQVRPNLLILIDTAASMAKDVNGNFVGVDSVGAPNVSWSHPPGSSCDKKLPPKCNIWTYTLTYSGNTLPSRMAMIKNALGNSVALTTGWTAPGSWPSVWSLNSPNTVVASGTGPWTWVGTWTTGGGTTDPGPPFDATTAGSAVTVPAQNIIGQLADKVNWGLMSFGGAFCSPASTLWATINSLDTGDASALQPALKLNTNGGLGASGNTPTVQSLTDAKAQLQTTFSTDPKKACNRPYGIILVTDGPSDLCNPSNLPWGTSCPTGYTSYPPGVSESIWNTGLSATVKPRVYAIGIGPDVNHCELNYTAYRGRTDANSPNSDAGFDTAKDPYLPPGYDTSHEYAFFAKSNESTPVGRAFPAIVVGTATGDYATSALLSGAGAAASNIVTIPSTEFPSWRGHLYAYDSAVTKAAYDHNPILCYQWLTSCYAGNSTDNSKNPCIPCLKWDAGYLLTDPNTAAASRKIYTWNPANGNALVEVTATNLTTLQAIALATGAPGLTAAHVDFIRGNDGAGSPRPWRLGPIINSAPALIAVPLTYTQGTVDPLHQQFRIAQSNRTSLLWAGADDGMLHGFRLSDGYEQVALLPPSLFGMEMTLYDNYKNQGGTVTGQLPNTTNHVYGVASSLRFADVYFSTAPATFKTVGFLTLGPGGSELTAIDLTHPSPGDYGFGFGSDPTVPCVSPCPPVQILWRLTGSDLPGLFNTWSLPALAPVDTNSNYVLLVGGGFNKDSIATSQVDPFFYALDPTNGTLFNNGSKASWPMAHTNSPTPLVGNQAFANSVLLQTTAKYYQEDNVADLGLQADLNGRIWFAYAGQKNSQFNKASIGIDPTSLLNLSNQQPIYYPPAASGYGLGSAGYDVFAFASGTLYERSASVSGSGIGTGPKFEPSLYIATAQKASPPSVSASNIFRQQIKNLVAPTCPATPDPGQPPCIVDPNAGNKLNATSQVTAPPYLLVPRSGKGISKAFFLVDDPTNGCNGFSYVVELDVTSSASYVPAVTPTVYGASLGAASGFIITDNIVRVAKSGLGAGAKATIATVPNVTPASGGTISLVPQWWRKLK